ncbi:putative oligopeptide transporter [Phakopsora pachyrhizi]|nr:putative oligopeptide transporter [Phakopsora pachyrhizi]
MEEDKKIDSKIQLNSPEATNISSEVDGYEPIEKYDVNGGDPIPLIPGLPVEGNQLSFRAVAVGCILGSIVQASNIYLGLKTGFTFGASLFGSLMGFALLKPLSKLNIPLLGGRYFGPKENCTVQTAATAAGSLGILFVSGVPAMYQLGLLSSNPKDDLRKLILFTTAGAFFGMAFAIPLRKHYILRQKLVFPTPTATAIAIHGLHSGPEGEEKGRKQVICLSIALFGAIFLRVVSQYVPGVLWDWHWGWWLYLMGAKKAVAIDNWTWYLEFTPAFFGIGILAGLNASLSFYLGAVLAWGIIGPLLVATGFAFGSQPFPEKYPEIFSYQSMNSVFASADHPSPRYWLLWPGILIMIASSFTELGMSGKKMISGLAELTRTSLSQVKSLVKKSKPDGSLAPTLEKDESTIDPAADQLVPGWAWGSLLLFSIILTCVVMKYEAIDLGVTLLAILLGFLFSFIGVQSSGDIDINPISTCAKASQIIIGGATHHYSQVQKALTVNLLSGMIAGAASNQTTDMVGDLRTGHLLGASPKVQFFSQLFGAFFSIFLAPTLFALFSQAYPCILDLEAKRCEFGAPSVGAWRAVAVAVTSKGSIPIPKSSWIFSLCVSVLSILVTIAKYKLVSEKNRKWVPNMNAIGLGFIVNVSGYASAMGIASVLSFLWKCKAPQMHATYAYSLAAGMMSGEGLGGVVNAVFSIAEIDGQKHGSSALCPANHYCG